MATRSAKVAEEPVEEVVETTPEDDKLLTVEDIQSEDWDEEDWDSTKMDPKEVLFPGGPNFGQINAWKEQYGDVYVTSVTPTKHVVWRTISRFEYRRLTKNLEMAIASGQVSNAEANLNNEEEIVEMCVLYPQYNRDSSLRDLAGLASTLSQQIMEASGFNSIEVRQL